MYKRILVPIDTGKLSGQAMQQGLALAKQLGASVVGFVVEALPALPSMGTNLNNYQREVAAQARDEVAAMPAGEGMLLNEFARQIGARARTVSLNLRDEGDETAQDGPGDDGTRYDR